MARGEPDVGMAFVVIALHGHIVEATAPVHTAVRRGELADVCRRDGPKDYEPEAQEHGRNKERGPISPRHDVCCCITPQLNCTRLPQRRAEARLTFHSKASNCDGFLGHRARQLQLLVLRHEKQARTVSSCFRNLLTQGSGDFVGNLTDKGRH